MGKLRLRGGGSDRSEVTKQVIAQVRATVSQPSPGWMGAVRCYCPEGKPGPLTGSLYFSTGIKKDPNKFFVPRTVIIGGKVRSRAADHGCGSLISRLRSAWLGCRMGVGGQAVELTPDCAPTGCTRVPHGQDDHQTHYSHWGCGQPRPGGGRPPPRDLPGELPSLTGRERWNAASGDPREALISSVPGRDINLLLLGCLHFEEESGEDNTQIMRMSL